jgi:vanillate O-demethylase monooxygenase subunit
MFDPAADVQRLTSYHNSWRQFWHPVATVQELDELGHDELGRQRVLGVTLCQQRLVVTRLEGTLVAMNGTCPHRSADLALGWRNAAEDAVVCRYHGFEWGTTGRIACIPALQVVGHALPAGPDWHVPTYHVQEKYGLVWVCLDPTPRFPILDIPEYDDQSYTHAPLIFQEWQAGCGRMMEAGLDNYHFAFTHVGSGLGSSEHPNAPRALVTTEQGVLYIDYETLQPVNVSTGHTHHNETGMDTVRYQQWATPNVIRLVKTGDQGHYVLVVSVSPVTIQPLVSRFIVHQFWDYDTGQTPEQIYDFQVAVSAEDQLVVESMRPQELRTDLDAELQAWMDRPTVNYRRWLAQMGIEFL